MAKNICDCIDIVERLKHLENVTDQDIHEYLAIINPFLEKRYGKEFTGQLEKLFNIRDFDKALLLLNTLTKHKFFTAINPKIRQVVFLTMLAGGALTFFILGISNVTRSKNSGSWPTVEGIITKSRVESQVSLQDDLYDCAYIEFSYIVDGTEYISDKISYSFSRNPVSYTKKYPVGKQVQIYYNPKNPKISVLEPGFSPKIYLWFLGGIILIFFLIPHIRKSKKKLGTTQFLQKKIKFYSKKNSEKFFSYFSLFFTFLVSYFFTYSVKFYNIIFLCVEYQ